MEDTPDKVRRNVVTLSALIIAASILNIELTSQTTAFGIALTKLNPLRFWLCVTSALLYLALRYRFDEKTAAQLKSMEEEYRNFGLAMLRRNLSREMGNFLCLGHKPTLIIDPETYANDLSGPSDEIKDEKPKTATARAQEVPTKATLREGQVHFTSQRSWANGSKVSQSGGSACKYRVPFYERLKITIYSTIRLAAYSKSGVDVLMPFVLAGTAFIICITKLAAAA